MNDSQRGLLKATVFSVGIGAALGGADAILEGFAPLTAPDASISYGFRGRGAGVVGAALAGWCACAFAEAVATFLSRWLIVPVIALILSVAGVELVCRPWTMPAWRSPIWFFLILYGAIYLVAAEVRIRSSYWRALK